jgi:hypothetical protein
MTKGQRKVITGAFLASLVALALAPGLYWILSESGPFRWITKLQIRWLGSFGSKLSIGVSFISSVALAIPYAWLGGKLLQRAHGTRDASPALTAREALTVLVATGGAIIVVEVALFLSAY